MTTAITTHTLWGRVRTVALASTLALATLFPVAAPAFADGEIVGQATVAPYEADTSAGLTGIVAIVDAEDGSADLLETAAPTAKVLTTLTNGTEVTLEIDTKDTVTTADGTRYWPVGVGGTSGWVSGFDLSNPADVQFVRMDAAAGMPTVTCTPYDYTGSETAEVAADGDGLIMRAEPGLSSAEVMSLPDGAIVTLRISDFDTVYDQSGTRWWPVDYEGTVGWVAGTYLVEPGTEPSCTSVTPTPATTQTDTTAAASTTAPSSTATATTAPSSTAPAATTAVTPTAPASTSTDGFQVNDWAEIQTPNGNGVNLLVSASENADETGFAPNQGLVQILQAPGNGWYQVRWDRTTGYIQADLLIPADAPSTSPTTNTTSTTSSTRSTSASTSTTLEVGGTAIIDSESNAGVNVRTDPKRSSNRSGFLADGAEVEIVDGPTTEAATGISWYRVTDGTLNGWVDGALLDPSGSATTTTTTSSSSATATTSSSAKFSIPVDTYTFTQDFGCSSLGFYAYDPAFGCSIHDGVDLATSAGTPIHAAGAGNVVASGWCDCGLGYYVEIDHGSGLHTVYGHMQSQPPVAVGTAVKQGDVIGSVGSTGLSTGPHVHFMVRQDGVAQDPKQYLPSLS